MIISEQLHKIADELTPNASVEDAIDRLLLLHKIETGLKRSKYRFQAMGSSWLAMC